MASDSEKGTVGLPQQVFVFAVLLLLWMLLAGSLALEELIVGALVALLVSFVARPHLQVFNGLRLTPMAPYHLAAYLSYFLIALVRANFDMASRVLAPSLPIHPAMVEVTTSLESDLGRMLLANSITLTPGTLTVDFEGDRLLVHCVACKHESDLQAVTDEVAAGFEKHIRGFLK